MLLLKLTQFVSSVPQIQFKASFTLKFEFLNQMFDVGKKACILLYLTIVTMINNLHFTQNEFEVYRIHIYFL